MGLETKSSGAIIRFIPLHDKEGAIPKSVVIYIQETGKLSDTHLVLISSNDSSIKFLRFRILREGKPITDIIEVSTLLSPLYPIAIPIKTSINILIDSSSDMLSIGNTGYPIYSVEIVELQMK